MKVYGGNGSITPLMLNLDTYEGEWSASRCGRPISAEGTRGSD